MITKVDPVDYAAASTVQVDTDVGNFWLATGEVERWAADHGFMPAGGVALRPVLVAGQRRFRAVCYRLTDEDVAGADEANRIRHERVARMPVSEHAVARDG